MFQRAGAAHNKEDFYYYIGQMAITNNEAFQYVWKVDPGSYCPAFQMKGGDGRCSSQLSESLWNAMREIRFLPLTRAYVELLFLMSSWFSTRHEILREKEAEGSDSHSDMTIFSII
tara:strand:+ start:428 stop:775 length:348 start_codon:yes stop_codon:yes gene_type:complete